LISSPKSWDDYFIEIMVAASGRSKDPSTKVGAVIVDENKKIVGIGYNGFPPGINETEERWQRPHKYDFVVHAEMNAIFNSDKSVRGCTIYLPFWPCKDCAKNIAAAGIREVVAVDLEYYKNEITETILRESGILIRGTNVEHT